MEAGKSPEWLPAGWTEQVKGKNDRKYKVYIDPLTGRKFYSKPQVSEYLRTVQHNSSALQQKKTGTVSVSEHNISELTGGKTYKKEEEPQNAIKAKETSRKSTVLQSRSLMQPVEEVVQLLASDVSGKVAGMSPDWLPAGWTEHVKDNNGRKVKCYVDPLTGRKFYSKPQVTEYLRTVELNSSASQQNKNANICELTGGKTTLKQKGSQVRTRSSKQVDMGFSNESAEKPQMDELTGGETSVKEGKSQNNKPLKQTSCKSERKHTASIMQQVNKVVTESVTPDGLPPGWCKEIRIRKKANGTRKDPVWISSLIL